MRFVLAAALLLNSFLFIHGTALAHEVYVLDPSTISKDISAGSPNPFITALRDEHQFELWAIISFIVVAVVFLISTLRVAETKLETVLLKMKPWAPLIARITLGSSLFASAYYNALFGPELPLMNVFHSFDGIARLALFVTGAMITFGFFTRAASFVALIMYCWSVAIYGIYMTTYLNYFGEIILNLVLGSGAHSVDAILRKPAEYGELSRKIERYGFAALRVCFGIAVIFASWYAKFLHSDLAMDTVIRYHLTDYFRFEPLFVVLGAFIIELLIGIFFVVGFEIRFTAILFITFLTLSLIYFGEVVWPHLILLGVNLTFLFYGYDRLSLEGRFFKRGALEPVL